MEAQNSSINMILDMLDWEIQRHQMFLTIKEVILMGTETIRKPTRVCISCSKPVPIDSNACPYCEIVLKWVMEGKLRPNWQQHALMGPAMLIGPLKRKWLKVSLVKCEVNWDFITLHMADGTSHKIKRGEYEGSWVRVAGLLSLQRWELVIKPINGKKIRIYTLLVKYPEGKTSIERLVKVLGLKKSIGNILVKAEDTLRGLAR